MMQGKLISAIAAVAILGGCSSRPRQFAPVVVVPPAESDAYRTQWLACRSEVAAGAYHGSGRVGSAAAGVAAGAGGAVATGAAMSGTYASFGGAAAAMGATIIAAPIAALFGAWGLSKIKKTKKERAIKAETAACLAQAGYSVDKWRVLSKQEARALDAVPVAAAPSADASVGEGR